MLRECRDQRPHCNSKKPMHSNAAVGVGLRYAAASRAEKSDRAGGGRSPIGQRDRQRLAINRKTVTLWRERFAEHGLTVCGKWLGPGAQANLRAAQDRSDRVGDAEEQAERDDAVELPADGRGAGGQQVDRQHHLAKP